MASARPGSRPTRSADAIRAGRKALDISQLCTLRPLPETLVREIDPHLVTLIAQAEAEIRARVALKLATCSWAPTEAVRALAFDDIQISEPVLRQSVVLCEHDLIKLAAMGYEQRRILAVRDEVPPTLCQAIARWRERDCLELLAENTGAHLPDTTIDEFVNAAADSEDLQTLLAQRESLSPRFRAALFNIASDRVKDFLIEAFPELKGPQLEMALEASRKPDENLGSDTAAEKLVGHLTAQGSLTKADALRAARGGRNDIADHAVSRLTGLPVLDWRRALSRAPVRTTLLAARAMAMTREEAAQFYTAWADFGRAHELDPMALANACADTYTRFARDEARKALHRLGASASIH